MTEVLPAAVFEPETAAGGATALVLGPVTPRWDEGAFFAPVTSALTRAGVRVVVADTLALYDESVGSMAELTDRWRRLLPSFGPVDLLCGNALGGAVAQCLLDSVDPSTAVLLVSGPARTDQLLDRRLSRIGELAAAGRPGEALALLSRRVLPEGHSVTVEDQPEADADDADETAARRLAGGMGLLCGLDTTRTVESHPGPLLNIVGSHSQLVTARHTAAAPHHSVHVVPRAGMRPHTERTADVSARIEAFLREEALQ